MREAGVLGGTQRSKSDEEKKKPNITIFHTNLLQIIIVLCPSAQTNINFLIKELRLSILVGTVVFAPKTEWTNDLARPRNQTNK